MTVLRILTVLFVLSSTLLAKTDGAKQLELKWRRHYDSAKVEAQKAKRPLVVVIEKPDSSQEKIDETKLTPKDRKKIATEKFELVRVDATTDYGKRVAKAFGARKFPYTAVTDKQSVKIVFRKEGQMSQKDWTLALAKSSDKGLKAMQQEALKQDADGAEKDDKESSTKRTAIKASSILWQTDLAAGQSLARERNVPVLLYITSPGCTYCQIMKHDAFTKPWIIDDINNRFVPVQINGRVQRDVAGRYGVRMFPTMVVLGAEGQVLHMWSGYSSLSEFESQLSVGKSVR